MYVGTKACSDRPCKLSATGFVICRIRCAKQQKFLDLPFAFSVDLSGRVRLTGVSLPFLTVHTLSGGGRSFGSSALCCSVVFGLEWLWLLAGLSLYGRPPSLLGLLPELYSLALQLQDNL